MAGEIETLKKINYENLEQMLLDINRNFAVIQNSPLYKGIPGKEGDEGDMGDRGIRGSKFAFVDLSEFQSEFPNELIAGSNITLTYLNNKLSTFGDKQKVLNALGLTELVDKDNIVLSNSLILSYNFDADEFVSTDIAFNEAVNLATTIEKKIEDYVKYYFDNNQTIDSPNVFESFASYAKNYADTNNAFVTTALTASSIYAPYIPGYNNNTGIALTDHKYFGFNNTEFPKDNKGTFVLGSLKKYTELLMNTILTDGKETLSSDYAPGVNNIPSAVFMQDTYNAGLLFGYKGKNNLKKFGSIYKNEIDQLVIKSDSGKNPSEYSEILLHKNYLKYAKLVQFSDDLEISRDLKAFGDINNKGFRTGKFTTGALIANSFNSKVTEIGVGGAGSINKNVSEFEDFTQYLDVVLVTNTSGRLLKTYKIETNTLDEANITDLNKLLNLPNSATNLLTTKYFDYLGRKINSITNFVKDNYWRKNQFETGEIQTLNLSTDLIVGEDASISGVIDTNKTDKSATITADNIFNNAVNITFSKFKKKLFITDANGLLLKDYSLDEKVLDPLELVALEDLEIYSESDKTILTTKYYAHLAKKINNIIGHSASNYYTKAEFSDATIPTLVLSNLLRVTGNVQFTPLNGENLFSINKDTKEVTIGGAETLVLIKTNTLKLRNYVKNVLVTDDNGNVLHTYHVEPQNYLDEELLEDIVISDILSSDTNLAKSSNLSWLAKKINNIVIWVKESYWNKTQFGTGEIPNLVLSEHLQVNGSALIGNDATDPNYVSTDDITTVGKINKTTTLRGNIIRLFNRENIVAVTNVDGDIISEYSVEGTTLAQITEETIENNHWTNNTQDFGSLPSSDKKFLTSNFFGWIGLNLKVIRKKIFERPTFTEMNNALALATFGTSFKGEIRDIHDFDGTFLSNFNISGLGLSNKKYVGWALMNGNNGTPDAQGRVRITVGNLVETYLNSIGEIIELNSIFTAENKFGFSKNYLTKSQLPANVTIPVPGIKNTNDQNFNNTNNFAAGDSSDASRAITVNAPLGGNGAAVNNMQPSIAVHTIMKIV